MIPFPYNQKLITCLATTLSCELLRQLLVKIENICVFKIYYNKKHGNVFKNWLCPSFLLLPKKSELPKLWAFWPPPRPVRLCAWMILINWFFAWAKNVQKFAFWCSFLPWFHSILFHSVLVGHLMINFIDHVQML